MNRREWLGRAALLLAVPRQKPDSTGGGDPLFRPDVVQQREVATAADNDPGIQAIERRLKCTCGCNLDIYTCRTTDFTCQYSPALHQEVVGLRTAGRDDEAVLAAFVAKYGEQILMAPPPRGFNLAGYLVPSAAVLLVGGAIGLMLLRRARRAAVAEALPAVPDPSGPMTPADQEKLRRALADVQD